MIDFNLFFYFKLNRPNGRLPFVNLKTVGEIFTYLKVIIIVTYMQLMIHFLLFLSFICTSLIFFYRYNSDPSGIIRQLIRKNTRISLIDVK